MCVKDHGWISLAVGQFYSTWSPSYSLNPSSLSRQALVTGRALKAMTLFSLSISAVIILVFEVSFIDPVPFANTQHMDHSKGSICVTIYTTLFSTASALKQILLGLFGPWRSHKDGGQTTKVY